MARNTNQPAVALYSRGANETMLDSGIGTTVRYAGDKLEPWIDGRTLGRVKKKEQRGELPPLTISEKNTRNDNPRSFLLYLDRPGNGTNTLQDMLNDLSDPDAPGEITHLVAADVHQLLPGDTNPELLRTLAEEWGVSVHLVQNGITIHGDSELSGTVLRVLKSVAAPNQTTDDVTGLRAHSGGRPPIGLTGDNGVLVPGERYELVCDVLQRVRDGELSERRAADRLDCAPATVNRAVDRVELYDLD